MTETELDIAKRHVAEMSDRVKLLESLVAEMDRKGQQDLLPAALALLEILREILSAVEAHLDRELAKGDR
jgi:hypothetical protein